MLISRCHRLFPGRRQYNPTGQPRQLYTGVRVPTALIGLALLTAVLAGCGGIRPNLVDESAPMAPRTSHFGVALSYPYYLPRFQLDTTVEYLPSRSPFNVTISIDTAGLVTALESEQPERAAELAPFLPYLGQARFVPALHDTVPIASELTIQLLADTLGGPPAIAFPVEPNRAIRSPRLYWETLRHRGIEPARLLNFPSYNFEFPADNFSRRYPLMVFRVDLDTTGDVVGAEPVMVTNTPFDDQLRTAIHWAEFEPLKIDGTPRESSPFLIISLVSTVDYPTAPAECTPERRGITVDCERVRLVPDTVGVILSPVTKRSWSGEITDRFFQGKPEVEIHGRIFVDSIGIVRSLKLNQDFWKARNLVSIRSREYSFFPARDLYGTPQGALGTIYLDYLDESNIRIWFDWDDTFLRIRSR